MTAASKTGCMQMLLSLAIGIWLVTPPAVQCERLPRHENPNTKDFSLRRVFLHAQQAPGSIEQLHTLSARPGPDDIVPYLQLRHQPLQVSRRVLGPLLVNQAQDPTFSTFGDVDPQAESWHTVSVAGPDLSDKATVVNLGKMCSDAYMNAPSQPDWLNATLGFNQSYPFGWQSDGLRGHVFADKMNKTIIVAFKGTSIDPRDKWRNNDRLNDNLLFSCCCATQRPDPYPYGSVCDCRTDQYRCNSTCLTQELTQQDRYYSTALSVMQNVTSWYPDATDIWAIGHSLGGSIASLVGLTLGIPSVSIEAPPQKLAAERLGLTSSPLSADFHIGNTADPVFMGACNGFTSSCSIAGFAFESQCHTGKRCVYDTQHDKGWRLSIANHRINVVVSQVLEAYNTTPVCEEDTECVDCYNWSFGNSLAHLHL